jgi:uncharacterized protein (TIGR02588 family)
MSRRKLEKNLLEWVVVAFGFAAVLVTLGFLGWDAAKEDGSTPDLQVELGSPVPDAAGVFKVPVAVRNLGGGTAQEVRVTVLLERPGAETEQVDLDIAYVPRGSRRQGWAAFRNDPAAGRLTGWAAAYTTP